MFQLPKSLLIIDVETTGTSVENSSIIQLGAVVFTKEGNIEPNTFCEYIIPYKKEWDKEAEKIHGIELGKLKEIGKPIETVLNEFEAWGKMFCSYCNLQGKFWLGQWGANFDVPLLKNAYKAVNKPYPFHYRVFDIASIVRLELAKRGKLEIKCGEDKCAHVLGINFETSKLHDALYDAMLSAKMLEKITKGSKCSI